MTGGTGANTITVGNGTNTITGGGGADILTGGTGSDTFNFSSAVNLVAATTVAGGAGNDTIQMTAAATLTDAELFACEQCRDAGVDRRKHHYIGRERSHRRGCMANVITGAGATSVTDSNGVTSMSTRRRWPTIRL